jgi:hypothetical protein
VTLSELCLSLVTRRGCFLDHHKQDLDEGLEMLSQYANDGRVNWPVRFRFACEWVVTICSGRTLHPSVSTAYKSALSSMQDKLLFAPTFQLQHATLVPLNVSHRIPLDYASYQVDLQKLEEAIETLERGKELIWSEIRHLRTLIDQPLAENCGGRPRP